METFEIYTNLDSYGETEVGEIYVRLNDYSFPEEGWTDFGFNIVFWWLDSFIQLHLTESEKVQCDFMDGSYRFDIKRISKSVWEVELIAERENDEVRQKGQVNSFEATESLIKTGKMLKDKYIAAGNAKAAGNFEMKIQKLASLIN